MTDAYKVLLSSQSINKTMSQILIQEKKRLAFEEICPRASRLIHRTPKTTQTRFVLNHGVTDFMDCRKCMVGEAWGNSDDYLEKCAKCINYSGIAGRILERTMRQRMDIAERFTNHWNKVHSA